MTLRRNCICRISRDVYSFLKYSLTKFDKVWQSPFLTPTGLRMVRISLSCASTRRQSPPSPSALIAALLPRLVTSATFKPIHQFINKVNSHLFQVLSKWSLKLQNLQMQISSWLQTTFTSMLLLVISCQSEIACCHWLASWHALIASIAKRGRNHSVYGIDILFISFQILLVCPFLALFLLVSSCFLYLFFLFLTYLVSLSCIFRIL